MSATVIILLIGLWMAILMPGLVRARREVSPAVSISRFNRSMDLLERTGREPDHDLAHGPPEDEAAALPAEERAPARHRQPSPSLEWLRPPGGLGGLPATRHDVIRRRRAVLASLAGAVAVGLLLTPLVPVLGWPLLVLGLVALAAYVGVLWDLERRRALRSRVRHLAPEPTGGAFGDHGEDPDNGGHPTHGPYGRPLREAVGEGRAP